MDNRRNFLKRAAGFSFAVTASCFALPSSVKGSIAAPFTEFTANTFLNQNIRKRIAIFKSNNAGWEVGETHCHTIFSDGNFTVTDLALRASWLGLDFIVITEHQIPKIFDLECSLRSFQERLKISDNWNFPNLKPIKFYPGLETSTKQGHIITVFPEGFLQKKSYHEIRMLYGRFDEYLPQMELVAKNAHRLNGVTIIPHPEIERSYPFGAKISFLKKYLTGLVDAIEDISSGHGFNKNYSNQLAMASIGSSDDHFNMLVGTTLTAYDAKKYSGLPSAIQNKKTRAIQIDSSLQPLIAAGRLLL